MCSVEPSRRGVCGLNTLNFEDQEYNLDSLSDELKQLVQNLQVANQQVAVYTDTLNLLMFSRIQLQEALKNGLKDVDPVAASVPSEEDTNE